MSKTRWEILLVSAGILAGLLSGIGFMILINNI